LDRIGYWVGFEHGLLKMILDRWIGLIGTAEMDWPETVSFQEVSGQPDLDWACVLVGPVILFNFWPKPISFSFVFLISFFSFKTKIKIINNKITKLKLNNNATF